MVVLGLVITKTEIQPCSNGTGDFLRNMVLYSAKLLKSSMMFDPPLWYTSMIRQVRFKSKKSLDQHFKNKEQIWFLSKFCFHFQKKNVTCQ